MTAPTISTVPRHRRYRRRRSTVSRFLHLANVASFIVFNVAATAGLLYAQHHGLIAEWADHLRRSLGGF